MDLQIVQTFISTTLLELAIKIVAAGFFDEAWGLKKD